MTVTVFIHTGAIGYKNAFTRRFLQVTLWAHTLIPAALRFTAARRPYISALCVAATDLSVLVWLEANYMGQTHKKVPSRQQHDNLISLPDINRH